MDINFKDGIDKVLNTAGEALANGAQWCRDNPMIAAALLVGTRQLVKTTRRRSETHEKKRQRLIWDPAARHYWETKRELKQSEWLEVERLKRQGMTIGEALAEMNLLKR